MTREQWSLFQVKQDQKSSSIALAHLFTALVEEETDFELLDELAAILEKRRNELRMEMEAKKNEQ